ncbi:MAG: hypothetical protein AB1757_09040 [Acidobacteriota bacterium]
MNQAKYDDQLLTNYLLGRLSAEETERLDELSFTDEDFHWALQAVENDLIDDYAQGKLSGKTLERFKAYLASAKRRDKVAFAQSLQSLPALQEATKKKQPAGQAVSDIPLALKKGWLWNFFNSPSMLRLGFAAAVMLLIALGSWLTFDNLRLRNQARQLQAESDNRQKRELALQAELARERSLNSENNTELENLRDKIAVLESRESPANQNAKSPESNPPVELSIFPFTLAPQLRGAGQLTTITIPAKTDYVSARLELETSEFAFYRAELKSLASNQPFWKSAKLKTRTIGNRKVVVLSLRSALLKAESYVINLFGITPTSDAEIIGSYPFKIIKQ